jgi:DNA-3-methyladenine glycosylase II
VRGSLDLEAIAALSDDGVRAVLTSLRGIGPWTADVYLTMALRRPDAFPHGDLALLVSAQRVKRLDARPTPLELEQLAEPWRPHRATAARILWHAYLSERSSR